ncbi:ankyrin repeat-containing domain protein [Hypoxylon argillaceum]|nr:ankyrin repeat-containing domain protein [Hypoxylon argillaceum]
MPWADVLQIVASGVSIVDCSYRLAKFIKHLNDDVREIHEWLTEMKTRIDTLHEVLNWVETIARDPNMKNIDDLPINIIHDIVQGSKSQVAKILGKLPQPPDNGVVPKLEAVLKKLMEDRAIKEHVSALQQWTSLLQAMIGGLTLRRMSVLGREEEVPAPPYQPDDDLKSITFKVDAILRGVPDKVTSAPTEAKPFWSILDEAKKNELQWYESRVEELKSERRFLEAATEQGNIIDIHHRLKQHKPITTEDAQEEALLVEKQADYLIQCFTFRRHFEAATLLENIVETKETLLTNEVNGRIMLKIGELYMAGGKLEHTNDTTQLERAKGFLSKAATLLGELSPRPYELYLRSVKCLVRTLETLREPAEARSLKRHVERVLLDDSEAGLDHHINWGDMDDPECKAMAWCRSQTNPTFNVESLDFRFDSIIEGTTAIHSAVRAGQVEVLREMLVEVKQIDTLDSNGSTPLLIAAEQGHAEIFELLLNHNASLSEVDSSKQTVLHKCQTSTRNGHDIAIARLILDHEPDLINSKEATGKTALWFACEKSNDKMVEFLLDNNADPNIPSAKNQTPLQLAVNMRSSEGGRKMQAYRRRIIDNLLRRGADSNQRDNLDNTPLHTAALHGDLEVIELLLHPDYKTDINSPGRNDQTPVAAAAEHMHIAVVAELVSKGANITLKGARGNGKSAEDWAKGPYKALREALHPAENRRMSENSVRTHATKSSISSDSSMARIRKRFSFGREPKDSYH